MNRFYSLRSVVVMLAVAGILAPPMRAMAEERPHASTAVAGFTGPTTFAGSGHATHLGLYTEEGSVSITPTDDQTVFQVEGCATYTAANGDLVYLDFSGELDGLTGIITATITFNGGTGRFEDAGGTASLVAQLRPDGSFAVAVAGTIDY